jgi:hypothetical protein
VTPDLIAESGRESMPVSGRVGLLEAELMFSPFNGVSDATRSVSQAIHDLKLTVGWIRNTIALVAQAKSRGQTDETLAKGANHFLSWIECLVLAWKRGGHQEWQRVHREQYARKTRGEML